MLIKYGFSFFSAWLSVNLELYNKLSLFEDVMAMVKSKSMFFSLFSTFKENNLFSISEKSINFGNKMLKVKSSILYIVESFTISCILCFNTDK